MITLSWLLLIGLVGGALAVIDGAARTRGRGTPILAVIEIVVGALFVLSLFFPAIPLGSLTLAVITAIVLVIQLVLPGGKRGGNAMTSDEGAAGRAVSGMAALSTIAFKMQPCPRLSW